VRKIIRRSNYCVYILQCADGSYYTGYTSDLEKRIETHNKGRGAKYLRGKSPAHLVYSKKYRNYKSALNEERRIKRLTRGKKENLIKSWKITAR
jgi:putative endonuclease